VGRADEPDADRRSSTRGCARARARQPAALLHALSTDRRRCRPSACSTSSAASARYLWVTDYASWNEANHCGEPTCHRPELVAAYWRKLPASAPRAGSSPPRSSTCPT
jgi:hypothetical protein